MGTHTQPFVAEASEVWVIRRTTDNASPLDDAATHVRFWSLPFTGMTVMFGITSHRCWCGVVPNSDHAFDYAPGDLYHRLTRLGFL
jgi:hypothetical protein